MHAAQYYLNPPLSEFIGHLVGPGSNGSKSGDGHKIYRQIEIDGLHILVHNPDLMLFWRKRRHQRQGQLAHVNLASRLYV
jgi:hypothetical protein